MKQGTRKTSRGRKILYWIVGLLLFYTVAGFLILPPIVRYVAVSQLSERLGRTVSIQKVALNPFAFSAAVRGLTISEKDGSPFVSWDEVYVNFQPTSVFGKAWVIKEISTSKPVVHVNVQPDGSFNFSDILARFPASTNPAPPAPKSPSKPLAVRIEQIRVADAEADLVNWMALTNLARPAATNAVPAPAPTNTEPPNIVVLRALTNVIAGVLASDAQIRATVDDLEVTNAAMHFQDKATARPASLDLTEINLAAKHLSNVPGTNMTTELSLRWNKDGSIKVSTSIALQPPAADIQFDLDRINFGTLDPYLEPMVNLYIYDSQAGLHGAIRLRSPENELPQISFNGDAWLDHFHTVDGVMAEDLLKWDSVHVSGIDVAVNPLSAKIQQIAVNDAYVRAIIESNKTINLLNALRLTNAPATNAPAVAKGPTTTNQLALPPITIASIVLSNAMIHFTDRSVDPNVDMAIEQAGGTISDISSDQLQHGNVDLHAVIDGVGPAAITGTINPFSGTETNDITISVKDVDLTPTSPYAGKFAGYRIREGKLNLQLVYKLVGTKLDAKNVIVLDKFTFGEKVDSADATHLPVRLAIAILKDREGKIVLDVPVQGSLADPKFRIGKVVKQTLLNILERVATSPFSLLGAAFGGGGEELSYQEFDAGSSELTADDLKKLDVLAKALYERPGLQMEISGSVDPIGDRQGLERAALDRQIRSAIWMNLRKSEQATNSVDSLYVSPEDRARWIQKLYNDAVSAGKITADLITTDTNLAMYAAQVLPKKLSEEKGATRLMRSTATTLAAPTNFVYQTRLVPPPSPTEAVLLATYPVSDTDFETLAADRAKAVRAYLLQTGKVDASRLFIKQVAAANLQKNGSRVYLQLQ